MSLNLLEAHLARAHTRLEKAEVPAKVLKSGLEKAKEDVAAKRRKVEGTVEVLSKRPKPRARKLLREVAKVVKESRVK